MSFRNDAMTSTLLLIKIKTEQVEVCGLSQSWILVTPYQETRRAVSWIEPDIYQGDTNKHSVTVWRLAGASNG